MHIYRKKRTYTVSYTATANDILQWKKKQDRERKKEHGLYSNPKMEEEKKQQTIVCTVHGRFWHSGHLLFDGKYLVVEN